MRNTKSYILFNVKNWFSKKPVFELKQWIKTPEGITTAEFPFTKQKLLTCFPKLPEECIKPLLNCSETELYKLKISLEQQTSYLQEEQKRKQLLKKSFATQVQSLFTSFRQQAHRLELYHAVPGLTSQSIQVVKCSIHSFPVELKAKVLTIESGFTLQWTVLNGKQQINYTQLQRRDFLLLDGNTYYQLTAKAYEAIEWADSQVWPLTTPSEIAAAIITLREKGIMVEEPEPATEEMVSFPPQPQVYVSELSNTFLKLAPQFLYDGFLMDGPFIPIAKVQHNGQIISIKRDAEKEEELVGFLRSLHPKFSNQHNGFFYLTFAEAQQKSWFLKTYYQLLDKGIDLPGMDLLQHFRYAPYKPVTTINQQHMEGNWVSFFVTVEFGKEKIPLHYLQKSLLAGQKAILLKDGSLGVLGEEWMLQYGQLFRHGKIAKDTLLVPRWLIMSDELDSAELGTSTTTLSPALSKDWLNRWKKWEKQTTPLYPLPSGLQIQSLRPYQQKGYEWLRLLAEMGGSGLLADDMGLGKTLQSIAFLLFRLAENPTAKHLIVAPASLLYNWQDELTKFAPSVSSVVYHGNNREEGSLKTYPVIITSYGTLRQDSELLLSTNWNTAILDESHNIKNPSAQITRIVWQLKADTRIALSGTPVMNNTEDLHSQFQYLLPGLLGSAEFFRREYALPIQVNGDAVKAELLKKMIRPYVLRRTKEQAAPDLPAKTESIIWCEMEPDQRAAYESIKDNVRSSVLGEIEAQGLAKGKLSVLAGLTKLRQICNSAELVKNEDLFTTDSIKTKLLIEELKTIIPQHRVLVFSQFTSMLDLLERDLYQAGINTLRLDGQTKTIERRELVNSFQQDETKAAVFLISLKAGNAGLNLTKADYVFLFDPWWNTAVENQAIDRTHRIGQQQAVFAYRMICRGSIEEKIIRMASAKNKLAAELVTVDEGFVKSLSLDDIKYLLE
jgi:superfamily II DNA or RNA helicase